MTQENELERCWITNTWARPRLIPSWVPIGHDAAIRVEHCLAECYEVWECVACDLEPLLEALVQGIGSMPGI